MTIIPIELLCMYMKAASRVLQDEHTAELMLEHGAKAITFCLKDRDFRDDAEQKFAAEVFYNGVVFGAGLAMALIANGALSVKQVINGNPFGGQDHENG